MKKEILLVEDDKFQEKIFRKIISAISVDLKCEIVSVDRGEAAIEYVKENSEYVKIVILDMALPDISGAQVITRLHKIAKKIPIFALSANEDKDLVVEAMSLGAKNYFIKGKEKELEKLYIAITETIG